MKSNFSVVTKLLGQNPKLAGYTLRTTLRIIRTSKKFRNLDDFTSDKRSIIYFRITPLCNLKCVMCGQRGDKGNLKGEFAKNEAKTIIPIERYKKLVDELKSSKPIFYMWGGEPFLYPDFMDLAKYIVDSGIFLTVNTNGTWLEKHAERIVKDGWHSLMVSLDGDEETNDSIRGKGTYQSVLRGFEAIKREKLKQGTELPYTGIVSTISNKNYDSLDKLVLSVKDFGLNWHIINMGTYTNESIINKHKIEYKNKLGVDSSCLEAYSTGYNENIDTDKFAEIITKVKAIKNGYPIIMVPNLEADMVEDYYLNPEVAVKKDCPIPWSQANINYNGDVHFCADYPDYVIGNIKDDSFSNIFNNEKAQKFRKELQNSENGCFIGCNRCYQNMLFGRTIKNINKVSNN